MKVFEIGVGELWQSRTLSFIGTEVECYLFEPNPISYKEISDYLKDQKNFKVFNVALGSENKTVNFLIAKGSSFVEGITSPEACNDNKSVTDKVTVQMEDIRNYDTGDIDILLIDVEGSEFDIIKNLISRPKRIVVEMFSFGVGYKNPFYDEIMEWMTINNYKLTDKHEDFIFDLNEV